MIYHLLLFQVISAWWLHKRQEMNTLPRKQYAIFEDYSQQQLSSNYFRYYIPGSPVVVVVTLFSNIIHYQNTPNANLSNKDYPRYCKHVLCWRPPEKALAYLACSNLSSLIIQGFIIHGWSHYQRFSKNGTKKIIWIKNWYQYRTFYFFTTIRETNTQIDDDVIKWKHFLRHGPFVRGAPHKGQLHEALMFSFICGWTNG